MRLPVAPRRPLADWILLAVFLGYLAACIAVYFAYVAPWIDGTSPLRIGADSDVYWFYARLLRQSQAPGLALVTFGGNFLGPVGIALLCRTGFAVLLFNLALLLIAIRAAGPIPGVDRRILLALLILNPETAISLITLNKEILVLLSAVLAARYIESDRRSWLLLAIALFLSLLARWEQAAILLIFLILTRRRSFFARRPYRALVLVIAGLSAIYPLLALSGRLNMFALYAAGGNFIVRLNAIQNYGGFALVLPAKILMMLAGRLITPSYFLNGSWALGFDDIHSAFILPLFSLVLLILFFAALAKGMLNPKQPIALVIWLYLIVTVVTPFIQPRYEFFVYVLLCLEFARRREGRARPAEAAAFA